VSDVDDILKTNLEDALLDLHRIHGKLCKADRSTRRKYRDLLDRILHVAQLNADA
jgi:hypothetical protein